MALYFNWFEKCSYMVAELVRISAINSFNSILLTGIKTVIQNYI